MDPLSEASVDADTHSYPNRNKNKRCSPRTQGMLDDMFHLEYELGQLRYMADDMLGNMPVVDVAGLTLHHHPSSWFWRWSNAATTASCECVSKLESKRVEKEEKENKMVGLNEKILFAVHFWKEQEIRLNDEYIMYRVRYEIGYEKGKKEKEKTRESMGGVNE